MNPRTKLMWLEFQRRHGLFPDGVPGARTLAKVLELEDMVTEGITAEVPVIEPDLIVHPARTARGRRIDWIVIHHNGTPGRTAADIRRYHTAPRPRGKGWSDIGYHRVYLDGARAGEVEFGRPPHRAGAHAKDFNDNTLGYVLIGNGDDDVFDAAQVEKLRRDVRADIAFYKLTPARVIGHREVNQYVGPGDHQTLKECPGRFFDMDAFRASLR